MTDPFTATADRLIKDVVTACDNFDVNKFIPLLRERIRIKNPFIRQLLVG
jgi:vacuole morphology and inheritance protein 14